MATTTWTSAPTMGATITLATYNTYHAAVRTAILALGWVQTTDTGQVDFSTNLVTANDSTYTVWQMFRMDDALQATAPVFLKVYYQYFNTSGTPPQLTLVVGHATDGAGTFTGDSSPLMVARCGTNSSTVYTNLGSGDSSRLWIMLNAFVTATSADPTTLQAFFLVERSKDATGANTGDYVTLITLGGTVANKQTTLDRTYGPTPAEARLGAVLPYTSTSTGFGGSGGTYPVYPLLGRAEFPLMDLGVGKRLDFPNNSNTTISAYGALRTYKALSSSNTTNGTSIAAATASGDSMILARWE